jgi:hypothetical protein
MRLVTSKSHVDAFSLITGQEPEAAPAEKTYSEQLEEETERYTSLRQASREQYQNIPTGEREVHKEEYSDDNHVIKEASKILKDALNGLIGKGGFSISLDEFRRTASHNSAKDDQVLTDKSLLVFAVNFMVAGTNEKKTAKFIVEHDEDSAMSSERLKLGSVFYDKYDNEYKLSAKAVENFLAGDNEQMRNTEQPIAYFDAEVDGYEAVDAPAGSHVVAARLREAGFDVTEEYVDACNDPARFGRLCYMVDVPLDKADTFKKVCAMSNDEWFSRGKDANSASPASPDLSGDKWWDRSEDKCNSDGKNLNENKVWFDRSLNANDAKNPYGSEKAQLASDAMKKDASKKAETAKNAVSKAISDLKDLCK